MSGARAPITGFRIRNSVTLGVPQVIPIPRIARKVIRLAPIARRSLSVRPEVLPAIVSYPTSRSSWGMARLGIGYAWGE